MHLSSATPVGPVTFLFNKTSSVFIEHASDTTVRGKGNQHDHLKGIDIRLQDGFIRNGRDNYSPFRLVDMVKKSVLQKRAYQSICALAAGKIVFQNRDGSAVSNQRQQQLLQLFNDLGINHHQFTRPITMSNYLFGGSPVTMSWGSNGRAFQLMKVAKRDYKTMRLSKPSWRDGQQIYAKHYYHHNWGYRMEGRNRNVYFREPDVLSWIDWNKDPVKHEEKVCFFPSYHKDLPLGDAVNRCQSYFIRDADELSDHYPLAVWVSGTTLNYLRAEFLLSCFDIDDIENGMHASGILKVYHKNYKNPESGEAKNTFEKHKRIIQQKMKGAHNSGGITVVPVGLSPDGKLTPVNDHMEFEPIATNNTRDRHEVLDRRVKQNILSGNSAIYAELFGIASEKSSFSEGNDKLLVALRILNQFTVKPIKGMLDHPDSGFLNVVGDILGIQERAVIAPNIGAFLNIAPDLAKHFMHPDQWYEMYQDFGLAPPTIEQQQSGLIPAYVTKKTTIAKPETPIKNNEDE